MIQQFLSDLNIIAALEDEPNDIGGLTAAQLKARFDLAGNEIKQYINETLLPGLEAGNIGFSATENVPEDTVQAAISNVQGQIADVTMGQVPNASVTEEKLAEGSVTLPKISDSVYVTQAQAETGEEEEGVMNPLRTAQAIQALSPMSIESIVSYTVPTQTNMVRLDLTGVDLTPYRKLELVFNATASQNAYWYLRLNDCSTELYSLSQIYAGSDNVYYAQSQPQIYLRGRVYYYNKRAGEITFLPGGAGFSVGGSYLLQDGAAGTFSTPVGSIDSVEMFLGDDRMISAGSTFEVYGVRK